MKMRYVVIAAVVVVLVLLAVYLFGRSLVDQFGVAARATCGRSESAAETQCMQQRSDRQADAARRKTFAPDSVKSAEVDVPGTDDPDGRGRSRNTGN